MQLFNPLKKAKNKFYLKRLTRNLKHHNEYLKVKNKKINSYASEKEAAYLKLLLEEIQRSIVQFDFFIEEINNYFMIFMVGLGNSGKSTLLNALIEDDVADVDVLPKTWKIDIFFKGGKDDPVGIYYKDGSREELSKEEAVQLITDEEEKVHQSRKELNKEFKKRIKDVKSFEEKEEIRAAMEKYMLYRSPITEIRWPQNSEGTLLDKFRLVDTPGISQDLLGEVKTSINEFYHKADGVIWLFDATTISAQSSRKVLDDLNMWLEEVGGSGENIIAVLSSSDKVRNNGGQTEVERVRKEAEKLFGDIFNRVIPVSAREALDGILNNDKSIYKKSNIEELKKAINNQFYINSQELRLESKKRGLNLIINELQSSIEEYLDITEKNIVKLSSLKENYPRQHQETRSEIYTMIDRKLRTYEEKVQHNIENMTERVFYIEDDNSRKAFIQGEIFDEKALKRDLNSLQNQINRTLMQFKPEFRNILAHTRII